MILPWAIVPAHNESPRIAVVLRTLLRSRDLAGVLVVDDGSTDGTADVAEEAGAIVLRLPENRGKGQAMRAGVDALADADALSPADAPTTPTVSDLVAFFDADLVGLTPEHIALLVDHARAGWDMVCGLSDYGWLSALAPIMPIITGQRIVRRWVLDAVHPSCWADYSVELGMNDACCRGGGRTVVVPLPGLRFAGKTSKQGVFAGLGAQARMFGRLDRVGGNLDCAGACELPPAREGP